MLTPYKIADYCKEYHPLWTCAMPDGCPPDDVLVPLEHPFFRLAKQAETYSEADFKSYAETDPQHYKGIIALMLNPTDGVVRQTGVHRSHYTWWRTRQFQMSNLKMLQI